MLHNAPVNASNGLLELDFRSSSTARSLDRSINRSITRSIARSIDPSLAQSLDRSIVRSIYRSIAILLDQALDRSIAWSTTVLRVGNLNMCDCTSCSSTLGLHVPSPFGQCALARKQRLRGLAPRRGSAKLGEPSPLPL